MSSPERPPVEVRRAGPADEPAILALATRTLGWDRDPRFGDLYRWKHDQGPFGTSPRWVAVADGQVVGFRVLLPWRFTTPAGTVTAVRAVDTATDPDHQGRGIFRTLTTAAIEELAAEGVDLVFNTPNDQSRPGYLKMGWTELGRPPVAVVPRLRSAVRIMRSRTPAELWSEETDAGTAAGDWYAHPANAEGIDELLAGGGAPGTWATDRSLPYLIWRYGLAHLHYRVLSAADVGGSSGAATFRVRRRGPSLEATVTEVFAPDSRTRRRLLRGVLGATGADYLLVAAERRADLTPSVASSSFSPLVTWRRLSELDKPPLAQVRFSLGDLELF